MNFLEVFPPIFPLYVFFFDPPDERNVLFSLLEDFDVYGMSLLK